MQVEETRIEQERLAVGKRKCKNIPSVKKHREFYSCLNPGMSREGRVKGIKPKSHGF